MNVRILLGVVGLALSGPAVEGAETADERFSRLAVEDSSYLRSQVSSVVDWYPWGPEAWGEAARSGRPVFVSIGNFSCAWTSRVDRDVFRDQATASLLNERCVNVKVDRLERPDLDRLYRRYAEATGQRAGWPMNVWTTADRLPIRVAAALTAVDEGQGSLPLETAHFLQLWAGEAASLSAQARIEIHDLATRTGPRLAGAIRLDDALIDPAFSQILGQFDPEHGGFGRVPKFPSPARLALLARRVARDGEAAGRGHESRDVIRLTLEGMGRSGLRDHLGGGFFRYALDEAWRRPYFEKMALDQALMVDGYLLGHRLTGQADFAAMARETLDYAIRELGHPEGGFYTAEHCESKPGADTTPREGAYYAWTLAEVQRHAGDAAEVIEGVFDVRERGNLPPGSDPFQALTGANVLAQARPVSEVAARLGRSVPVIEEGLARGRASLLAARAARPRPALDRLLITQMNAALVSSLCRAGSQLQEPAFLNRARRAADFIRASLWDESTSTLYRCRLDRAPRHLAVAEDHAYLIRALLDLHETTGEIRWLQWAAEVQSTFDRHHADPAGGGYFDARHDAPDVPVALKSIDDAGAFSPNAVAGMNLMRWAVILQDPARDADARRLLGAFAVPLQAGSSSVAGLFEVVDALVHPPRRAILIGPPDHPAVQAARARLAAASPGRWIVLSVADAPARQWLVERQALPPAAANHPLENPAVFLPGEAAGEKGPIPMMELDKMLHTLR